MHAVRVADIAGIRVLVHPLTALLVALVAVDSAAGGRGGLLENVSWLVLLFGCVLVHELAHSIVAKRRGVAVRQIVLLPIGGVSQMERLPERPADELVIAVAGPLASMAIAAGGAALAAVSGVELLPIDLYDGSVLHRLVWGNVVLGAFNLLPAFPMDGGRVLRAALALRWSLERATRAAAVLGRALAVVLAAVGMLFNLWLVLIAAFVYVGASAEELATRAHVRFKGRRVEDAMVGQPLTLPASLAVGAAERLLGSTAQREFPVLGDSGQCLGMIDAATLQTASPESPVGQWAHAVPSLDPDDDLEGAAKRLIESGAGAAPVIRAGEVIGMLRLRDMEDLITCRTWRSAPA